MESKQPIWKIVSEMCRASEQAYSVSTATDPKTDAHANVFLSASGQIVIAFRGSRSPRDFIQDFKAVMVKWDGNGMIPIRVHLGFLEDYQAICLEVIKQVIALELANPKAGIYITGHSLGGALAKICAFDLHKHGHDIAGVYTFGSPRAGDLAWRTQYDLALQPVTWRFVNANDIVPRAPGWLMKFRHPGREVFFTPGFGVVTSPSLVLKFLCDAFGLWGAFKNREDVLISEHFISAYQKQLMNYV